MGFKDAPTPLALMASRMASDTSTSQVKPFFSLKGLCRRLS